MLIFTILGADAYKELRFAAVLQFESSGVAHLVPYLDTRGIVTIGVGFNIETDATMRSAVFAQFGIAATETTVPFDADLAAALDGALGANQAVLFRPDSGDHAGRLFAVIDANGDGAYQAGQDYVFEFVEPAVPIAPVTGFFV